MVLFVAKIIRDADSSLVDFVQFNELDYFFWRDMDNIISFYLTFWSCLDYFLHKVPSAILSLNLQVVFINKKNDKQMERMNQDEQDCIGGFISFIHHKQSILKILFKPSNNEENNQQQWFSEKVGRIFLKKKKKKKKFLNIIATVLAFVMVEMLDTIGDLLCY